MEDTVEQNTIEYSNRYSGHIASAFLSHTARGSQLILLTPTISLIDRARKVLFKGILRAFLGSFTYTPRAIAN